MAREYVDSTSIDWFDFDARARALEIAYASGGVYRYWDVPPRVCDQLRAAESKGRFVNEIIKTRYRYTRVRPPQR
ncbi:MAG TPA: KTSC domain-containing protein [Candidatus Elarobacter sp.]|nr:KTSC domain-containing protein [Candidatus Elarobacter sp.]